MPHTPSPRMRTLASRWLVDLVQFETVTTTAATRATLAAGSTSAGVPIIERASVRRLSPPFDQDAVTVDRSVRDLIVWVDVDSNVVAGMRCTVLDCDDDTLVGKFGPVLLVERDSVRYARRVTVRMGNDE